MLFQSKTFTHHLNGHIMERKIFFEDGIINMNTNVSEIAHLYEDFLRNKMLELSLELDSSNEQDEETVRRAAFLARHNYVKLRSFRAELGRLQFAVQDAGTPTVTIVVEDEKLSCDCPTKKPCRHQLAAMFTLYQYVDSLSQWLEDFRNKKVYSYAF